MKNRILNRLIALALLLLAVWSLCSLIAETFSLNCSSLLPLWIAGLCLAFWLSACSRKMRIPGYCLALLLLFLAYRTESSDLRAELQEIISNIRFVYEYYLTGRVFQPENAGGNHSFILLALAALLAFYLSLALFAERGRIALVAVGYLPFVLGCIAVNGTPRFLTVFAMMLFLVLLVAGGMRYQEGSAQGMMTALLLVPTVLVLLLSYKITDPSTYSYSEEDIVRSRRIDRISEALSAFIRRDPVDPPKETMPPQSERPQLPFIGSSDWNVDKDTLDMSSSYPFYDRRSVVLRVRSDRSECLYLRRCSYGDYQGKSWLLPEDNDAGSALAFCAMAAEEQGLELHTVDIQLLGSSDLLLIPYFSPLSGNTDSYLLSGGAKEYSVNYYPCGSGIYGMQLSGAAAEQERQYRDYAHSHYTELPETTDFSAKKILEEAGIRPDDPNIVRLIASYVQTAGYYDLNVSPSQSRDYAVYFLTQSHRGYCIHFASAAVVLFRAAGIPSRLADGFMFTTKAGEYVDVLQSREHAWAEVYIDGLGWVPIEVTGRPDPNKPSEPDAEEQLPSPFSPRLPAWSWTELQEGMEDPFGDDGEWDVVFPVFTPSPTPSPTPTPTPTPSPSDSDDTGTPTDHPSSPDIPPVPDDPDSDAALQHAVSVIKTVLFILLPAVLFISLRQLSIYARKQAIRRKDTGKAAISIWREAKRLRGKETNLPREIMAAAERAAFGRTEPDAAAMQASRAALRRLEDEVYASARGLRRLRLLLRGRICR